MRNLFEAYAELPKFLRRPLWRVWHNYLLKQDTSFEIKFMNYGYASLDKDEIPLNLEAKDEFERYCINLYHHDVSVVDVEGKDVLEVGCGRGGGASYIARYLKPRTYTGLDLSKRTIAYCNRTYNTPGLSFVQGKAEDLPFLDESFDAVVNVESSRCYSNMKGFLSEVHRVLRPGGHLLFSDMRSPEDHPILQDQFLHSGLVVRMHKNILPNVVKALELDNDRRIRLITEKSPRFLHSSAKEFSGTIGSKRYNLFHEGKMGYYFYHLQKEVESS